MTRIVELPFRNSGNPALLLQSGRKLEKSADLVPEIPLRILLPGDSGAMADVMLLITVSEGSKKEIRCNFSAAPEVVPANDVQNEHHRKGKQAPKELVWQSDQIEIGTNRR